MLAMEAVKKIMQIKDIRPSELYNKLGIKSNIYSGRMKQKNPSTGLLNEMVAPMGYKVVIVPDNTQLPENSFTIE